MLTRRASFRGVATGLRLTFVALACAASLQGCGGGGDGSTAESGSGGGSGSGTGAPPAATNKAPTITGTPATTVQAGAAYSFTPQAADADGDKLTFSITNKPAWATFEPTTGRISGTPTAGNFAGVTIAVSDGSASASLSAFAISVTAASAGGAGSVTLSWTPPTARTDGSTLNDLAGYRIRYGNSPSNYTNSISINNPGLATYVIDNLSSGTYYFVVSAVDAAGVESGSSNPASKTIG